MQIVFDIESNIKLYNQYLLDTAFKNRYPFIEKKIYSIFPQLEKNIKSSNIKSSIIATFVKSMVKEHFDLIQLIQRKFEDFLNKGIFDIKQGFLSTMEYKFPDDILIELSLFPFSTFGLQKARISILDEVGGRNTPQYIDILIHELSHVFLEDILKKNNIEITQIIFDTLKESLAPIIMRNDSFGKINFQEISKKGNPEHYYLFIQKDGNVFSMIDFLEYIYKEKRINMNFLGVLKEMLAILLPIEKQLIEKKSLFVSLYQGEYMWSNEFKEKLKAGSYLMPIML